MCPKKYQHNKGYNLQYPQWQSSRNLDISLTVYPNMFITLVTMAFSTFLTLTATLEHMQCCFYVSNSYLCGDETRPHLKYCIYGQQEHPEVT